MQSIFNNHNIWNQLYHTFHQSSPKTFQQLNIFFQALRNYSQIQNIPDHDPQPIFNPNQNSSTFDKINLMQHAINQLLADCSLLEQQQIDCLSECLQIIIALNSKCQSTRYHLRRQPKDSKLDQICQVNDRLIQKITDFVIKSIIPNNMKKTKAIADTIISILLRSPNAKGEVEGKRKVRAKQKQEIIINRCLISGRKINLAWFLILKFIQQLFTTQQFKKQIIKQNTKSKQLRSRNEYAATQFIQWLLGINDSYIIMKDLLEILVQNISQIELSVIPLLLFSLFQILEQQFKISRNWGSQSPAYFSKCLFSLQNLDILLRLATTVGKQMAQFQFDIENQSNSICKYCAIENNNKQFPFQKITLQMANKNYFTIFMCSKCCLGLGFHPQNQTIITAFAPFIYTQFLRSYENKTISETKESLQWLLISHLEREKLSTEADISEYFAVNIHEEILPFSVIQGIYRSFLFSHNLISINHILIRVINMIFVYLNCPHDKLRERSFKVLNQQPIFKFLFESKTNPSQQLINKTNKTKDLLLSIAELKCRDKSLNVRVVAFELLTNIYIKSKGDSDQRLEFYRIIFNQIAFSENSQYVINCIEIIDKIILSSKIGAEISLFQRFQLLLEAFTFSIYCLKCWSKNNELIQKIFQMINKLLQTTDKVLNKKCSLEESESLSNKFKKFLKLQGHPSIDLKQGQSYLVAQIMKQTIIDIQFLPYLHNLTPDIIELLINQADSYEAYTLKIVKQNICNIIATSFDFPQIYCLLTNKIKQKKSIKSLFNRKELRDYFFSEYFIISLLPKKQSKDAFSELKLTVLNNILIVSNYLETFGIQHSKSKVRATLKSIQKINFSIETINFLGELSLSLLQQIKICFQQEILLKGNLITNIEIAIGKKGRIQQLVATYMHWASNFKKAITSSLQMLETSRVQAEKSLYFGLGNITRSLYILTSLAVQTERYLVTANQEKNVQKSEQPKSSMQNIFNNSSETYFLKPFSSFDYAFQETYKSITQILLTQFELQNQNINHFKDKIILLLNYYWELKPKMILKSSSLVKRLLSKPIRHTIIKIVYRLFADILPLADLSIISAVKENFYYSFATFFENTTLVKDPQAILQALIVLQHMLRSGTVSIHEFIKYIYCGLLHPQQSVQNVADEIIKLITHEVGGEMLLFSNFLDTMKFLFHFLSCISTNGIILSPQQEKSLQSVSQINRQYKKSLLARQKRQLRVKNSLVKRIGEIILNDRFLLRKTPKFLCFLFQIIKAHQCFDYNQLYQIVFSLNKVATDNYSIVQQIKTALESQDQIESFILRDNLNTWLAFKELLFCLTYLTQNQNVRSQLKNYQKQFQILPRPFVTLKQDENKNIESCNISLQDLLRQIEMNCDIAIGNIDYFYETKHSLAENESLGDSQSTSAATKCKRKSKKKIRPTSKIDREFYKKNKSVDIEKGEKQTKQPVTRLQAKLKRSYEASI